jgi:energy-converting hydrogenase Eha subunit H
MRNLIATVLSLTLFTSAAMAATDVGTLAPGKPAGVQQAQTMDTTALLVIGGVVAIGLAVGLSTASSGNPGGVTSTLPLTTSTVISTSP